jgi:predicted lipoprotein with Yx(FWY)xxD motif
MRRAASKMLMLWAAGLFVGLAAMVGVSGAGAPPTLGVFQSTVTNFDSPNAHTTFTGKIVGAAGGFSVYTLTGDSKSTPKCLSTACRMIWPWVVVRNGTMPTRSPLIKAKIGVWKHNGVSQVTLGGHPLYFFHGVPPAIAGDTTKKRAHGEGIVSFGGTWHVWKIASSMSSSSSGIPQGPNAGDRDGDNNGAPSDGDGSI